MNAGYAIPMSPAGDRSPVVLAPCCCHYPDAALQGRRYGALRLLCLVFAKAAGYAQPLFVSACLLLLPGVFPYIIATPLEAFAVRLDGLIATTSGHWLAGLMAPIYLKSAIDALGGSSISQAAVHASIAALLWSGACRVVNTLAKELQGPIFTPVSQVCVNLPALAWHNAPPVSRSLLNELYCDALMAHRGMHSTQLPEIFHQGQGKCYFSRKWPEQLAGGLTYTACKAMTLVNAQQQGGCTLLCRQRAGVLPTIPSLMCWTWTSSFIWGGAPGHSLVFLREVSPPHFIRIHAV